MGKGRWPTVSTTYPPDLFYHADTLHDEIESIGQFARESLARNSSNPSFPRNLRSKIADGISKGIIKAVSCGILPKKTSMMRSQQTMMY